MKTNIKAQFACSLDELGNFKDYQVVNGSTFTSVFSETLDSGSLILDQVKKEDRLYKLAPYQYVRVYDEENENFDMIFLVDNFHEDEKNINEHIFSYTINLMSETKLLEKIQCPNGKIEHKVNDDGTISKETIHTYLTRYVELYAPKIKTEANALQHTWEYRPIITVPQSGDFYNKFNVPCADTGAFSANTLRQIITMLMQQVGCIPVVREGVLSYLDFNSEQTQFGGGNNNYHVDNTVNFLKRSLSSDSYVNTLVNMPSNVLDENNEVICESIGFRDRNSLLLQQLSNLQLEVKHPIYKVNKCIVKNLGVAVNNSLSEGEILVANSWQTYWSPSGEQDTGRLGFGLRASWAISDNTGTIEIFTRSNLDTILVYEGHDYEKFSWRIQNVKIHLCKEETSQSNGISYNEIYLIDSETTGIVVSGFDNIISNFVLKDDTTGVNLIKSTKIQATSTSNPNLYAAISNANYVWIEGTATPVIVDRTTSVYIDAPNLVPIGNSNYCLVVFDDNPSSNSIVRKFDNMKVVLSYDITPLVLENSIRKTLNTNFSQMDNASIVTLEQLATFVYGTIGYSIGNKYISGFSTTFTQGQQGAIVWYDVTKPYIENIYNFIYSHFENNRCTVEYYTQLLPNFPQKVISSQLLNFSGKISNFSFLTFDIYYQALNSYNYKYYKDNQEVPIPIEQYDGSADATSDFDRLSIHEQEQVNRLGNDTLFIAQRTDDASKIQNLNTYFVDDVNRDETYTADENKKYVVYQRTIAVNNYCYNAQYTASENAILKNYFTSIRTKYRAYQYLDYSESVSRRENKTVFVCLSKSYFNGDDKIKFGFFGASDTQQNMVKQYFIDGCIDYSSVYTSSHKIKNIYERNWTSDIAYKNEISVISNNNSFAITYHDFDSASFGLKLHSDSQELGGIPQRWYLISDGFYVKPQLVYSYTFGGAKEMPSAAETGYSDLDLPLDKGIKNSYLEEAVLGTKIMAFSLCDNNQAIASLNGLTLYKNIGEIMSITLQFTYYTDDKDIIWTDHFIQNSSFLQIGDFKVTSLVGMTNTDTFEVRSEKQTLDNQHTFQNINSAVAVGFQAGSAFIEVDWSKVVSASGTYPWFKLVHRVSSTSREYYDVIAFRKGNNTKDRYYISFNDTKSDKVYARKNGILYQKGTIDKNTSNRTFTID